MDTGLEYLSDLAENELQKKIIQTILEKGIDEESVKELIEFIERGME